MADNNSQKPHILVAGTATTAKYTNPGGGGGGNNLLPNRNRSSHAANLITQLETLKSNEASIINEQKEFNVETRGLSVEFQSDPNFDLKLQSLEFQTSGIELCSSHLNQDKTTSATVFIPEGKLEYFLKKIIAYRDKDTKPSDKDGSTKPQNQPLVDSISEIKLAVLESLWTDEIESPNDGGDSIWWEVWIRLSDQVDHVSYFREHAERLELKVNSEHLTFVDRAVILVFGTKENMARSISLLGVIAELRQPKEAAGFFTGMNPVEQNEWVDECLSRITVDEGINTYACLLDSGINEAHPMLTAVTDSTDMHTYATAWGTHDGRGHGTPMAGLVAYGDLTDLLASNLPININHKLESVKILPNSGNNEPQLYGAITRESINRVEVHAPQRKRIFCMAVSATDGRDRGKPSSWSATVDAIASGSEDDTQHLVILCAGNTDPANLTDYPESNQRDSVHDPGQSWNALTVGGYTEKIQINDPDLSDYEPLAPYSDLAPSSCTSMTWNKNWPFKPDIVMEAGNMGVDKSISPPFISGIDDLELLSTHHDFGETLLVNFRETSAATALATRLSAILLSEYPDFWPETIRGLLVHSAEWTDAMKARFSLRLKEDYKPLLQYCGYGVPNVEKLFWSTNNSLTLIAQDSLQPFVKEGSSIKTRDINIHDIPWPASVLEDLGETEVEMKVTLSYFIEPNPGQRGWSTKYQYASHRLQFDVKRALESETQFKQRINKQAWDDEFDSKNNVKETGEWVLGSNLRRTGSIHSDTWTGTAMELSTRKYVAVYPLAGWWKDLKKHDRHENQARYSLVISITTPETDIYTEVAEQIFTEVVV